MIKLGVFIFSVSYGLFIDAGVMSSVPDYATLCPYNDFCTSKAKHWIARTSGMEPCCMKCSCAPDCHLVGNCCPDMPNKTNTEPEYRCVPIKAILNAPRDIFSFNQPENEQFFRVVDRCPNRSSSNNFPACENPTKVIKDYVIVSNVENEKIFKNRHCAICHGVQKFIEWDLVTTCPDILNKTFQTFEERDVFVLNNCWLDARPPNTHVVEMARCYNDYMLIRGCARSDVSNTAYDVTDLKKACYEKRSDQNTVFRDDSNSKLYSSVYCYLCNNLGRTAGPGICETSVEEIRRESVSFSSVLRQLDVGKSEADKRCKRSEIWDSFSGHCRSLYCPVGTIPVDGVCESAVVYSEGYALSTIFKVEFLVGKPLFSARILYKIVSYINGLFDTTCGCGLCNSEFMQSNTSIYFRKSMYTSKNCSVSTLLEAARSFVSRTENTTLICSSEENEQRFTFRFVKEKAAFLVDKSEQLDKTCLSEAAQIELQMLHDCPRFVMPTKELFESSAHNSLYLDTSGVVSICMEKYFQLQEIKQRSDAIFWQPHKITFGTALLFYLFVI